jgi:Flp pilus assembly protein TadG
MTGVSMSRRLRAVSEHGRRDTGAVTILFAVGIAAIIMIIAVSVDVSGSLRASFRARALAEQAARAGAEKIDLSVALAGSGTPVDAADEPAVRAAACGWLPADAQCVGDVVFGSSTVTVTVTLTYQSLLHGMFGIADKPQTATATALLVNVPPPSP